MRGLVDDLGTEHPLGTLLPGLYQDDDFSQRFCDALDAVLAPVPATLRSVEAYVDARLTPVDFLPWLAEWVGGGTEAGTLYGRRGQLLGEAADLLRVRDRRAGDAAEDAAERDRLASEADRRTGAAADVEQRLRELVHETCGLQGRYGTREAIARLVELTFGSRPEVTDTGGVDGGSAAFELVVRLEVDDADSIDVDRLDALVARAKPAHVLHRVEVVAS